MTQPDLPSNSPAAAHPGPKQKPDFRSRHRARSHDEAHADDDAHAEVRVPDHLHAPRNKADLLTTQDQFDALLARLRAAGNFAYDSEFIGESSYHPRLCVIQVATVDEVALIDPQSPQIDLAPFWALLCDASVRKIVHAGEQDIEPVVRFAGRGPANFFDTQIAAGFVGMAYPTSLSKLTLELTGVTLPKGLTFTDWAARPLSAKQLRYAADDVRYLPAVCAILQKRLAQSAQRTGRPLTDWCQAECDEMCRPEQYGFDPARAYLRVRGGGNLSPRQLGILRELTIWRDAAAREADLPPRSYLKDEVLVDLSRQPIKSPGQLEGVRHLPRPVAQRYGPEIFAATTAGQAKPIHERTSPARSVEATPVERFRTDRLFAAASVIALNQGIDPSLVTSRVEVTDVFRLIADDAPAEDFAALHLFTGWRKAAVAEPLMAFVREGTAATLAWQDAE